MILDFEGDTSARFLSRYCDRYCYLGGGSTTQVTKNETDPQIKALMLGNYAKASDVADTPYQAYTGERVAGFNPTQVAGQAGLLAAANDPTSANTMNRATGAVGGLLDYNPQQVTAGQLSTTDMAPYYNPFQSQVIDASVAQNERARQIAGVANNQHSTAAHAFGGSRQGVADALTNEGYDRNNQQNLADLNTANFAQARQGAQFDIANRMTAGTTNAANDLSGANLRLNAGNSFANMSNDQLQQALMKAGVISTVGDQQHIQQQDVNDAAYEEFMRQIGYPMQQQNIRNAAIGLLPNDGTQTGTTSKKYGLGDFLMAGIGGLSAAASGGAFGGK